VKMPILPTGNRGIHIRKKVIKEDTGLTFLEILIVVMIIGLSLAVITPAFSNFARSVEIKTGQRKIIRLLELARERAINTGTEQRVKISDDFIMFTNGDEENGELQVKRAPFYPVNGPHQVFFYSDGTSSGGSFVFSDRDVGNWILQINPVTGKPLWKKY